MNSRGFAFLLVVTVAAVVIAGLLVEGHTAPGLERTLWVALLTAAVVFPAARWAERRGWIRGGVQIGRRPANAPPPPHTDTGPHPAPAPRATPEQNAHPSGGTR